MATEKQRERLVKNIKQFVKLWNKKEKEYYFVSESDVDESVFLRTNSKELVISGESGNSFSSTLVNSDNMDPSHEMISFLRKKGWWVEWEYAGAMLAGWEGR
jgi:hypothetical protein